jgi:hypothetical protein
MKKLLILVLVVAAGYLAYQKFVKGEQSEETGMVQALADEFSDVKKQAGQAAQGAGLTAMDMTSSTDAANRMAEVLLDRLQELKGTLTEEKALQKADELEQEIRAFINRN